MTVQQLQRKQDTWSKEEVPVEAEQIAPLDRAAFLGSHSEGIHAGYEGKNRREFLTYMWAATLALATVGTGLAAYQFLYPRRPANEFGGRFYLGAVSNLPPVGSFPQANVDGRFWLVNTEDGPRAFYNLCTHKWGEIWIKYRWDSERFRFECPMCGSKFSLEGHYIEGPAPRSLDQFVIEIVTGRRVVAETMLSEEAIVAPSTPSPDAEIVVDTGAIIEGLSRFASPMLEGYRG
ncbi:MAG: Rieske 2Fe-2S domain-containing protein [Caldilineaceae bacterium SB0664_bin_27]|uniref:Rieske 2Fe-2S domain-containing protein n=1 Tax=Caldilineaceae bacterium SB0664_bin_27 TaxID=2605260 RepID=A0A6B0YVZ7_9CHLR|nr:Rieske 2Fe-2S domain-containing protein [Caldilineaceae bacterium SB0664_bin_27]